MEAEKHGGFSGNQVKIIAMIAMFSDHFGKTFFPDVLLFQAIGRIAFPIFAYMIAEGCRYTRNRTRYFLGIFLLGLACEAVYFAVTRSLYQNILLTFSLSIASIYAIDAFVRTRRPTKLFGIAGMLFLTLFLCLVAPSLPPLRDFEMDYGIYGVFLPIAFYYVKGRYQRLVPFVILVFFRALFLRGTHPFAFLALPFLLLYNGKRGKYKLKYLFYVFYPAHLAFIHILDMLI